MAERRQGIASRTAGSVRLRVRAHGAVWTAKRWQACGSKQGCELTLSNLQNSTENCINTSAGGPRQARACARTRFDQLVRQWVALRPIAYAPRGPQVRLVRHLAAHSRLGPSSVSFGSRVLNISSSALDCALSCPRGATQLRCMGAQPVPGTATSRHTICFQIFVVCTPSPSRSM